MQEKTVQKTNQNDYDSQIYGSILKSFMSFF